MKPIYILLFLIVMTFGCEKEKMDYSIRIEGYVKEEGTNKPISDVWISLWRVHNWAETMKSETYSDSTGYFLITHQPKEKEDIVYELKVKPYDDSHYYYDSTCLTNIDNPDKWDCRHKKYSPHYMTIHSGDKIDKTIFLLRWCSVRIFFNTNNPLNQGDSLCVENNKCYTLSNKPNTIFDDLEKPDNYYKIKWKIKRNNQNWVTHKDSIYCKPFMVNEYTIAY